MLILVFLSGCKDYFEDPMKDKETGDDVTLLLVDFNFFTTRMTFKFYDAKDSSLIASSVEANFTGKNGNDIVNFSGEKKAQFTTTKGQLELTIDPNVPISESSVFEFAINVNVDGYNPFSKGFQFSTKGKKTFELYLVKESDENNTDVGGGIDVSDGDSSIVFIAPPSLNLKSAQLEEKPYEVHHKIALKDFVYLKDTDGNLIFHSYQEVLNSLSNPNFASLKISSYSNYAPEIELVDVNGDSESLLFHKLETGTVDEIIVMGKTVGDLNGAVFTSYCKYNESPQPDLFGFADFSAQQGAWKFNVPNDTIHNKTLDINYTVAEASTETLCQTGSTIIFKSGAISSFSIDADVYDTGGNKINTINFKGNFPDTFLVENTPPIAVVLKFRNNNASFQPIPDLEIDNFCSGSYTVTVNPKSGYEEYQVALTAICPDNPTVGISPTYSGEIKLANSNDQWQGIDMVGGVLDILALPNEEYQIRLLWNNEWETTTFSTNFNEMDGSYEGNSYPDTKISSQFIEDRSRIRIKVEKKFEQDICNDMGW